MFTDYSDKILSLNNFEKSDILTDKFLLHRENNLEMYYAPHNEYINKDAKVFIIGICPGWTQTQIAYKTANEGLKRNLPFEEIQKQCKHNSRFAGSMRKNLIEFLDELGLHRYLGISCCADLFDNDNNLLHTTSVLPFPVFINNKNYTGHNPDILKSNLLSSYVEKYFYPEAKLLSDALIIPLGKSVDDVLDDMVKKQIIKSDNILFGFPHTSGANGHRKKQFDANREFFSEVIDNHFKNII
jgi:hypothetical protein